VNVCKRCGKENQDHYKFCLGCGGELAPAPPPAAAKGGDAMAKTMMADPAVLPKPGGVRAPTPPAGVPVSGPATIPDARPPVMAPTPGGGFGGGSPFMAPTPFTPPPPGGLAQPPGAPAPFQPNAKTPALGIAPTPFTPPPGPPLPGVPPAPAGPSGATGPSPARPKGGGMPAPLAAVGGSPQALGGGMPPPAAVAPGMNVRPGSVGVGGGPIAPPPMAPSPPISPMNPPPAAGPPGASPMAPSPFAPPPLGAPGAPVAPAAAPGTGPAAAASRACPNCGTDVPASFLFCGACGTRLAPMGAPAAAPRGMTLDKQPVVEARPKGKLTLIRPDGSEGGTHDLAEGENKLGRAHGAVFENDGYLSPTHAELVINVAGCVVRDLDSLNGVFVKMTAEEELQPGDVFRIGQELMRFDTIAAPTPLEDGTEIMGSPNPGYWGRISVIIGKDIDGSAFPLFGDAVTIGRERGDINFPDDGYVSGLHARLSQRDGKFLLADLGSSNGTFTRIRGERAVKDGTFILLGQQLFRLNTTGV
jgi:hypothetical protein